MNQPDLPNLPPDLQARLHAAGVRDAASLQQALDGDPALRDDYVAFIESHQEQFAKMLVAQLLSDFAAAADTQALAEFWAQVPLPFEDTFIALAEQQIVEAEQDGETNNAEALRQRLDGVRQIQAQQHALRNASPIQRALLAFLQAETEDAARLVFAEQRGLLQPYSAEQMLEQFRGDDPATQQRITERYELLRVLRGASAQPVRAAAPPTEADSQRTVQNSNVTVVGDLVQAERVYDRSAHAEGAGSTAIVYNINTIQQLERRWMPPQPPGLTKDVVQREAKVAEVQRLLEARGQVAIVGSGRVALAVQGIAGVGKTTLGKLLIEQVQARYPDGVLWEELGSTVRRRDDPVIQSILSRWGSMAVVGPQDRREQLQFEPAAVRMLLAEHPRLLVVLDNVWSLEAIRPLRDALPDGAHLIVTTRSREVMQRLGGAIYELGLLDENEALELAELRLNWKTDTEADQQWLAELFKGVGWHALALDIALSRMALDGDAPPEWARTASEIARSVREGRRFEDLRFEDSEREDDVELVLYFSYARMDATAQGRFQQLGALAPEASFSTALAAQLWQCDEDAARRQLNGFVSAALLNRLGEGRWQQHSLLCGYALALLRRAGEYERAAARHAAIYDEAMRMSDESQQFYRMQADYAQLQHAFGWAIDNDLDRAQNLIANCAELQAAFFALGRDNLDWCEAALHTAQQRGTAADIARTQGLLGNALSRVAALPGENRRERLLAALATYNEALNFYTPETTPLQYAATQSNRGNVLQDLSRLHEEDHSARLRESLNVHDQILRVYTPEIAPLAYALTQNNRGNVLQDLAMLPEEDRGARLREALAAYDQALRFYTPEIAPHNYAMTQNNCGIVLSELATLSDEDSSARLREGLAAFDEALRFYTSVAAPLDYAMTQSNRGNVLQNLAMLPGENRGARLWEALAAYEEALCFRTSEVAPLDYAVTQGNLLNVYQKMANVPGEDRRKRLGDALRAGWTAFALFGQLQHSNDQQQAAHQLQELRNVCGADFDILWQALDAGPQPEWLTNMDEQVMRPEQQTFRAALEQYAKRLYAAQADRQNADAWREAVEVGEALFAPELAATLGVNWDALRSNLASTYNEYGKVLDQQDTQQALVAFERAVELQPEFAMWRRNRAGMLIALERLNDAEAEIGRAGALEPDAARLAELDEALRRARDAG